MNATLLDTILALVKTIISILGDFSLALGEKDKTTFYLSKLAGVCSLHKQLLAMTSFLSGRPTP